MSVLGVEFCVVSVRFLTGSLRVPLLECGLRLGSDDGAVAMPAVDGLARGARRSAPLAMATMVVVAAEAASAAAAAAPAAVAAAGCAPLAEAWLPRGAAMGLLSHGLLTVGWACFPLLPFCGLGRLC